jgi:hypothetical protein
MAMRSATEGLSPIEAVCWHIALDVDLLCDLNCVIDLDAEVEDRPSHSWTPASCDWHRAILSRLERPIVMADTIIK